MKGHWVRIPALSIRQASARAERRPEEDKMMSSLRQPWLELVCLAVAAGLDSHDIAAARGGYSDLPKQACPGRPFKTFAVVITGTGHVEASKGIHQRDSH
jgi:hypothetical protein